MFRSSALTRHKGGRNAVCNLDKTVSPSFVCDCGKYLMYKGIPAHRNKCSTRRIRKIIFPDEFEADATYTAQGPSPMKAGGDCLGTSAVRRDESDLKSLYAVPGVVPDLGPPHKPAHPGRSMDSFRCSGT